MKTELFLATKDLSKSKKIVALIVFALTIGILNVAISTALISGFKKFFTEDIVEIFAGDIIITPPEGKTYFENYYSLKEKIEKFPEVEKVIPQLEVIGTLPMETKGGLARVLRTEFHLLAIDAKEEEDSLVARKIIKGDFLSGSSNEILLGYDLANNLDLDVGDTLTAEIFGKEEKFKVVGIVRTGTRLIDSMYAAVNYEDIQRITNKKDVFNRIYLKIDKKENADIIKYKLMEEGIEGKISTWKEIVSFGEETLNILSVILFLISGVAILSGSFGVAIMLYINVLHKTKAIGTIRALGAQRRFIINLYIIEGLFVGLIGVIVGTLLSIIILHYLSQNPIQINTTKLRFSLDLLSLIAADVVVMLCVFVASIYPSYKAASIEPVEAMRYE